MYKFSQRSLNNLEGLHPKLQEFATELIKVTPYDITITCGVRTAEEQNKLYQQGRTKAGKIVTKCDGYKIKSKHQVKADGLGYAFDIAVIIDNKSNWNKKVFKDVADSARELMKKYNIEWGGDWKNFSDYPHFQLMLK